MPKLISVNIATQPSRMNTLAITIKSLEKQVDIIRVCCNEFDSIPKWLEEHPKVEAFEPPFDLTDNGKFMSLYKGMKSEYYFTCDDDIRYPVDYVSKTIERIEKYGCIVTYHGRLLNGLGRSYYRQHEVFHCVRSQEDDIELDVCGTGVTAFDTDYFNPYRLWNKPDQRMSDLIFSLAAAKQGKILGAFNREDLWIQALEVKETIFNKFSGQPTERQNKIADEIFKIKHSDKISK